MFCTVKLALYPDVFFGRPDSAPPSGVTATPYASTGTLNDPLSLALVPVAVRVSVPVPGLPTL